MTDTPSPTTPPEDRSPQEYVLIPKAKSAPPPVAVPKAPTAAPPVHMPKAKPLAPPVQVPQAKPLFLNPPDAQRRTSALRPWLAKRFKWCMRRRTPSSFVTSAVVHAVMLIVLGLWVVAADRSLAPPTLLATVGDGDPQLEPLEHAAPRAIDAGGRHASAAALVPEPSVAITIPIDTPLVTTPSALPPAADGDQLSDEQKLVLDIGSGEQGPLEGRIGARRGELLESGGGTAQSEQAVELGLQWLAAHQRDDGGWHFDHSQGPCGGLCSHPGTEASTTGATGMALMCFLGAGNTHQSGKYNDVVARGLKYLRSRMLDTQFGGDLQEGTMYGQALATIALCEAYAMTRDRELDQPCHDAIRFIVTAQHGAGGWRCVPGQPGDMTVTGWQLMALKSGQLNYLPVPATTITAASKFLDTLAADEGAAYGYQSETRGRTTTSVGLLCRMYLGWPRSKPALQRGVTLIAREGPSKNDMYFNYYATQVLHHFGGALWHSWNNVMRDYLVETQSHEGHETGSWYFDDDHRSGEHGGRLYNTCMAIMTLEVYYRYLPIYRPAAVR